MKSSILKFHTFQERFVRKSDSAIYGFRKLARKYLPSPLKPRKSVVDVITELNVSSTRSTKKYLTASGVVLHVESDSSSFHVVLTGNQLTTWVRRSTTTENKVTHTNGSPAV